MPKIGLKMRFPHRKVETITKDLQTKYKGFIVELQLIFGLKKVCD
jgi:hypothetical protein